MGAGSNVTIACNRSLKMQLAFPHHGIALLDSQFRQPFHGSRQHSLLASHDDWPLNQFRMSSHEFDQLPIVERLSRDEFLISGLVLAQSILRFESCLAE